MNGSFSTGAASGELVVEAVAFFALAVIVASFVAIECGAMLRDRRAARLRAERARRDAALRAAQDELEMQRVWIRVAGMDGDPFEADLALQRAQAYANYAGFNEVRR